MKFKINPFLRLFYLSVKATVLFTFGIFYRRERHHNKHHFNTPAPCILISNHPNTLVDVLNVAKNKKAIVHFLANAGLFSSAFGNWFFSTFYAIKVERPKDVQGRRIDNKESFLKSADFLSRYGTLFIAAEGTSKLERRLRKLKTGAARIAFDTMQRNNWELPLSILPVGITYENPKLAFYDLFYNYSAPIKLINYKEKYEKDPAKAVKQLTADIQATMQGLLLHTDPEDEDIDKAIQKLERIHKNEFGNDHEEQFFISKKWIEKLKQLKYDSPKEFQVLLSKINTYCEALMQHKLTDKSIQEKGTFIGRSLGFLLGFPIAVVGWLNNIISFLLPDFIIKKTGMYPGYTATVKLVLLVLIFPITYWAQYLAISTVVTIPYGYLVYIVASFLLGCFALFYSRKWKHHQADYNWFKIKKREHAIYTAIQSQRAEIIGTVFSQLST